MYSLVVALLLLAQTGTNPAGSPRLTVEGAAEFAAIRTRLESIDSQRFGDISRLLGLMDPGPAIRVVLASETSDFARSVPPWIAGFATGGSDSVTAMETPPARAYTGVAKRWRRPRPPCGVGSSRRCRRYRPSLSPRLRSLRGCESSHRRTDRSRLDLRS